MSNVQRLGDDICEEILLKGNTTTIRGKLSDKLSHQAWNQRSCILARIDAALASISSTLQSDLTQLRCEVEASDARFKDFRDTLLSRHSDGLAEHGHASSLY